MLKPSTNFKEQGIRKRFSHACFADRGRNHLNFADEETYRAWPQKTRPGCFANIVVNPDR
jgi:hypothetical protein